MYFEDESSTAQCIEDLTREIWATIKLVLKSQATPSEIAGAAERAKFLRLYITRYRDRNFSGLTDTELWLAQEVADAVEDLID
ncbi:hypothetical protein SEA_DAUBENSKI_221 [Streptomyces phage Daubenski]|uniref:Uncharacterized protein n=1 Tax=Streptomyces phage Daubenski TaxID=2653725 RepID=A0A5Q2WII3_9CAUD|nr:hypothetical protein KNU80_gp083 [Streptomyces phage Daubenski]QGH76489.1 hypothetical protein SEA_DAUBENSKI_221 [Streptomyces phage Daubenski]